MEDRSFQSHLVLDSIVVLPKSASRCVTVCGHGENNLAELILFFLWCHNLWQIAVPSIPVSFVPNNLHAMVFFIPADWISLDHACSFSCHMIHVKYTTNNQPCFLLVT
jgi:hypothetical protein